MTKHSHITYLRYKIYQVTEKKKNGLNRVNIHKE